MSRSRNPFRPGVVALLVLVGAGAFLLALYAIGQGWTGEGEMRNGGEHGAATGLNGHAGLVRLLEATSHDVELSRDPARTGDYALLVLTPPHFADPAEITRILEERRYIGPTMLVLPKWQAMAITPQAGVEAETGWVFIGSPTNPTWFGDLGLDKGARPVVGATQGWQGMGLSGSLPKPETAQAVLASENISLEPLALDSQGDLLAGMAWPVDDTSAYPVLVVFEPDLTNNYGLADETRARLAVALVDTALQGDSSAPVLFDLTLSGLGQSPNLLTLAFRPPFLAATLCLLLAALVIGWRGFARFGAARAELPELAQGKRQLAMNGAALIARLRRWHLLADPWTALVAARITARLGLREHDRPGREAAIDRALARAGHAGPGFAQQAAAMRNAHGPGEILRAARALTAIERTLIP